MTMHPTNKSPKNIQKKTIVVKVAKTQKNQRNQRSQRKKTQKSKQNKNKTHYKKKNLFKFKKMILQIMNKDKMSSF